jgi:esterase/lipase superfamily enzyme
MLANKEKRMIIISSRKNFDDPDNVSMDGHRIKDTNLANDSVIRELTMQDLAAELQERTVLVLVHGYNNEQYEVYDAYKIIEDKRIDTWDI